MMEGLEKDARPRRAGRFQSQEGGYEGGKVSTTSSIQIRGF